MDSNFNKTIMNGEHLFENDMAEPIYSADNDVDDSVEGKRPGNRDAKKKKKG
jgi:hypothetical protein